MLRTSNRVFLDALCHSSAEVGECCSYQSFCEQFSLLLITSGSAIASRQALCRIDRRRTGPTNNGCALRFITFFSSLHDISSVTLWAEPERRREMG